MDEISKLDRKEAYVFTVLYLIFSKTNVTIIVVLRIKIENYHI